jgi:hypothetical protein
MKKIKLFRWPEQEGESLVLILASHKSPFSLTAESSD